MATMKVELVKYDMDKTKKRKRKDFIVEAKSEKAVIDKLEKIHKGEKVDTIHEIIWGEEVKEFQGKKSGEVLIGKVKFFDEAKGFGFIQPDLDMDDLFFHASSLKGLTLHDHDIVEFEVSNAPKGKVAINIKLVDQY